MTEDDKQRSRRVLLGGGLAAMATGVALAPGRADAAPGSTTWKLGGNPNVNTDGSNYLGSRNVAPLVFKTAAAEDEPLERMRITPAGKVGIGTDAPTGLLHARTSNGAAVRGVATGGSTASIGLDGTSSYGTGVSGRHSAASGTTPGVLGETDSTSSSAVGVLGRVNSSGAGGFSAAVRAINNSTTGSGIGVYGSHAGNGWGVYGTAAGISGIGVYGFSSDGYGVYGSSTTRWAGYFSGDVNVSGTLTSPVPLSRVDHPLAPREKYLQQAAVQSAEVLTVQSGNVTTDADGRATVTLPAWFEAVHGEVRYQLTAIGRTEVWVERELADGSFVVGSGTPRAKVSWQVTGVRTDPWTEAHPVVVELAKSKADRGTYLHPELYGAAAEFREGQVGG